MDLNAEKTGNLFLNTQTNPQTNNQSIANNTQTKQDAKSTDNTKSNQNSLSTETSSSSQNKKNQTQTINTS